MGIEIRFNYNGTVYVYCATTDTLSSQIYPNLFALQGYHGYMNQIVNGFDLRGQYRYSFEDWYQDNSDKNGLLYTKVKEYLSKDLGAFSFQFIRPSLKRRLQNKFGYFPDYVIKDEDSDDERIEFFTTEDPSDVNNTKTNVIDELKN